jgi:hypothetical protein
MVLLAALPFDQTLAFVLAAAVPVALITAAFLFSPKIALTQEMLLLGKMRVPVSALGNAEHHEGDAASYERGPGLSPGSQRLFRGDISSVVKIIIVDPNDPTEYLLFSSRKGAELVSALDAHRAQLGLGG